MDELGQSVFFLHNPYNKKSAQEIEQFLSLHINTNLDYLIPTLLHYYRCALYLEILMHIKQLLLT